MQATTDPGTTGASDVLDRLRRDQGALAAAEIARLEDTVAWAAAHEVAHLDDAAFLAGFGDTGLTLAGPGAPLVAESAVAELALALDMSTDAGARWVGDAVEIRHRLPRLWQRVVSGACPVWRARRVAQETKALCEEGADHVDRHVAPVAGSLSLAQLARVVAEALVRFDPDLAEQRRREAAEQRRVTVRRPDAEAGPAAFDGTAHVDGVLDLADALDLDAALSDRAAELRTLGSDDSLDVRRSLALGDLARAWASGQSPLDLQPGDQRSYPTPAPDDRVPAPERRRRVVLHVHLSAAALDPLADPAAACLARLTAGDAAGTLVPTETVRAWCRGAAQITVRPVLDPAESVHAARYEVPQRIRDQAEARDHTCVFPRCSRPAEGCDQDHRVPWPHGPTSTDNTAPLCRRHHRHKTHHGWSYVALFPGTYLWTSPHGLRYLRGPQGTAALDGPPPRDPPGG